MRRRVTRALFTAAAAGVTVIGLSLPASATIAAGHSHSHRHGGGVFTPSGGIPIPTDANCTVPPVPDPPRGTPPRVTIPPTPAENCARAGYQASGRDFRFAQALITVPDHAGSVESPADPALYVALDNSANSTWQYARVGIAPCPQGVAGVAVVPGGTITCPTTVAGNTSNWVVFAATADAGGPPLLTVHPLPNAMMGDGILVNVYLTPTGNSVQTVIQLPDGTTYNNTFPVTGPVYTHAQALADWSTAVENGSALPAPAVPANKTRDTQFFQGRFTTVSGAGSTFAGPWTLNALEVTSNGTLPPTGTLIAQPSYLWNDQKGFDGLGQDAFGVWRFPF